MRIAAAIFVGLHALGHVIWFMTAWNPPALGSEGTEELEARRSYFLVEPGGTLGRVLGALALLALVGFGASAWGIFIQAPWWPEVLVSSTVVSLPVIVSMWNPVGTVSARAFLADLVLLSAAFLPWGEKVVGAH